MTIRFDEVEGKKGNGLAEYKNSDGSWNEKGIDLIANGWMITHGLKPRNNKAEQIPREWQAIHVLNEKVKKLEQEVKKLKKEVKEQS